MSEQEISIKARESELYHQPLPDEFSKAVKPFPVYLRETPAVPFSTTTKVILWTVGIVVVLLFLAALWRVSRGHLAKPPAKTSRPVASTTRF